MSDPVIRRVRRSIDETKNRGGMQAGMSKVTIDASDATRLCLLAERLLTEESLHPQPAVPEGWRECLAEMVQAMHDYEMSVDGPAPYKHRAMIDRAHALLSATSQPEEVEGNE